MFPPELERDAFRAGSGEFGWTRAQIPLVVDILRSHGIGILGGEMWWVRDGIAAWVGVIPQRHGPPAVSIGKQTANRVNLGHTLSNGALPTRWLLWSNSRRRRICRLIYQGGFCTISLGFLMRSSRRSDNRKLNFRSLTRLDRGCPP